MNALIIVESHFGNTWRIGEAIAASLPNATLVRVDEAPEQIDDAVDLLLLGAPTHAFALSNAESRAAAGKRKTAGAVAAHTDRFKASKTGLREWIATASIPRTTKVIAFDTCVKGVGPLFGRASKKAAKRLASTGIDAHHGETFWVTNADELHQGELERAGEWGKHL